MNRHGKMTRIVYQDNIQFNKVTHQMREQYRAVLTVTIGIEEGLLTKEGAVATPHIIIIGIEEAPLVGVLTPDINRALYPPV